jgi:sec-independent protein translocase protein TatA
MSIGFTEILVIILVILLLFGAKRIPEIAKALGRASHEFKKAKEDIKQESKELLDAVEENAAAQDKQAKKDDGKQQ